MSAYKLIFHIGLHKTGSSALQEYLKKNKEKLLKYGILYPETFGFPNHCIYGLLMYEKLFGIKLPELAMQNIDLQTVLDKWREEIKLYNPSKIIISCEEFSNLGFQCLSFLIEELKPLSTDVVVYLRRQDKFIESLYQEVIKYYYLRLFTKHPFYTTNNYSINYLTLIRQWNKENVNVIPRIFGKEINESFDIVDDFLSMLGLTKKDIDTDYIVANISLSPLSTLALKVINEKYDFPEEIHIYIINHLFNIDSRKSSFLKKYISLDERLQLLDFYKESNKALFEEYFKSSNKFELSTNELKMYEEQEKIDFNKIENAVNFRVNRVLDVVRKRYTEIDKFLRRKIFLHQVYGHYAGITKELVEAGLITKGTWGFVDEADYNIIRGWIKDLEKREVDFIIKLNDIPIFEGKCNSDGSFYVEIRDLFYKNLDIKREKQVLEVIHKESLYTIPGNYREIFTKEVFNIKVCEDN